MAFIIVEIQASKDGSAAIVPPVTYTDKNVAEQKYHTALSAAAVSNVDIHTVAMLTETGIVHKKETYYHNTEDPTE